MRLAIVGGTGFIGRHLCRTAHEQDHDLVVLTRRPARAQGRLGPHAQVCEWDPAASALPEGALDGCDAVINLAGSSVAHRWTRATRRRIHSSRIQTTERIVERLAEMDHPPSVLLNASATGYYGARGGEELTESAQAGAGFLASVCCDWEAAATDAERLGVRVVPLRFGAVIGRRSPLLRSLLPMFRWGCGAVLGAGSQWMPWIHVADAVGLILHALETPAVDGPANAVAPDQVTHEQFIRALDVVRRRRARLRIPAFAVRLLAGRMAEVILSGQRAVPEVALRTGYTYQFPKLDDCLIDVLAKQ